MTAGDVVEGSQPLVADLVEEPPGETGRLPEGDDEPQPGGRGRALFQVQ